MSTSNAVPVSDIEISHDDAELHPVRCVLVKDVEEDHQSYTGYVLALPGPGSLDLMHWYHSPENVFLAAHYTGETKTCSSQEEATAWLTEKAQAAVAAGEIVNSDRERN